MELIFVEERLIDFTTFDGFKKYCEVKKVPLEIINNPAFEQFYRDNSGKISMIDKKIVSEDTELVERSRSFEDEKSITISAGSDGIILSYEESQRNYDNSYDKKAIRDKIELSHGNFVITEDFSYSRTPAEYQAQVSGYAVNTVSQYDNFGIETVIDYYSQTFSYDRNRPVNEFITNTDFVDTHGRYERKYFDVATYFEFDQRKHEVKNQYVVPLSGENGYSRIVASNGSNNISNFLDENIVGFLTPEDINVKLEREANPIVRDGLKNKYVNGRSEYSYIPSRDPNLVINGQNLQGVLADRMVQQMENNTVDVMGNPISQANDISNNVRTMGFGGMWLIGLITGIMSCGIILLGVFFK